MLGLFFAAVNVAGSPIASGTNLASDESSHEMRKVAEGEEDGSGARFTTESWLGKDGRDSTDQPRKSASETSAESSGKKCLPLSCSAVMVHWIAN